MPKTAFLFPGQGSQYPGMGKSLADSYAEAKAVFEEADEALGFAISRLCFEGPEEDLKLTENTQPALVTVEIAAFRVLEKMGLEQPDMVAGHSLGEYSALVAAGSLTLVDAVQLVRKRGQWMQKAVPKGVGAMAALLKLPEGKLESILAEAAQGEVVSAANYNSPDQIVIAGHAGAVSRAADLAKAAGAKRAVMLPVSAPFHCPLMVPAQERMREELEACEFRDLQVPLINNVRAQEVRTGAEACQGLVEQISGAVLWTQSMRLLSAAGVSEAFEVGPGSVLSGLMKSIAPEVRMKKFGDVSDLEKLHAVSA